MIGRRGKKIRQNAEALFGLQEQEFNSLFADKEMKPEPENDDDGGSENEIGGEELIAIAADRGVAPLVEVCRRLAVDEWVTEQRGRGHGGSYRYWRKDLKDKYRVVFGIAVSPARFDTPKGELDIWMWPAVVSEVTGVPEGQIRIDLKSKFAYSERGRQQCSVRLRRVEDAERLAAQLTDWFGRNSQSKAERAGAQG